MMIGMLLRPLNNPVLQKNLLPLPLQLYIGAVVLYPISIALSTLPFFPSSACDENLTSVAQRYDLMFIRL